MIKSAQKSIVIMTTMEGLKRKHSELKSQLEKAAKRGVDIKIAAPITPEVDGIAKDFSRFCKIKNIDRSNARFCLVDGEQLTFMLTNESADPSNDFGIWVSAGNFAKSIEVLFNDSWNAHKPIDMPSVRITKELRQIKTAQH